MNATHRQALLKVLARLDQMLAEAEAILAEPGDTGNIAMAEELRELVVEMRAGRRGEAMKPDRRAAIAVLVLSAIAVVTTSAVLKSRRENARIKAFREIIDYATHRGTIGQVPQSMLDYLGLPADEEPFWAIEVPLGDEPVATYGKVFSVRLRPGTADVILGDNQHKVGYLYSCSEFAELRRAVVVVPPPEVLQDGERRFAAELAFWAKWWAGRRQSD